MPAGLGDEQEWRPVLEIRMAPQINHLPVLMVSYRREDAHNLAGKVRDLPNLREAGFGIM